VYTDEVAVPTAAVAAAATSTGSVNTFIALTMCQTMIFMILHDERRHRMKEQFSSEQLSRTQRKVERSFICASNKRVRGFKATKCPSPARCIDHLSVFKSFKGSDDGVYEFGPVLKGQ